jgi:exodeoxyribonuclease VII large subunit
MAAVFSVSELNRRVRDLLEGSVGSVWVEGEISNYRRQSSGHHYFTLKDDRAQLACVMFSRAFSAQAGIKLVDGLQVQVFGSLSVYEARGQYQLVVQLVQSKGQGLLQARFEALKRKLQAEGLFEDAAKKAIPFFPKRIALVTSPTGAAVRDMVNILQRRSPWLSILICPVRVQGEGAAAEVAGMIRYLNAHRNKLGVDVMIVGRGGGSLEDLWQFNEEIVARAIFGSEIPVVSAVGHEIDFTIADFVADLRAPTPSAAAELVVPEIGALREQIENLRGGLQRLAAQAIEIWQLRLERLRASALLKEPNRIFQERQQRLDQLEYRLSQGRRHTVDRLAAKITHLARVIGLHRPDRELVMRRTEVSELERRLSAAANRSLQFNSGRAKELARTLAVLGPQQTLERGYTITLDPDGKVIRSARECLLDQTLRTRFVDGEVRSRVE